MYVIIEMAGDAEAGFRDGGTPAACVGAGFLDTEVGDDDVGCKFLDVTAEGA
jgi:hypothetical protein